VTDFRLNRVLSRPLTSLLLKTPLTPNQITLVSLAFGLLCGALMSLGGYWTSLAGAACYQAAIVLDNCDGEVARAKNKSSVFGGWLDMGADLITDLALFSGVTAGLMRQDAALPLRLCWALCVSGALIHFLLVVLEKLKGFGPAVFKAGQAKHGLFDALREGDASWFVVILCAAGQTGFLLWGGAVYMQALWIGALLLNFRKVFR
jgi:phosphatidylglycerophosphate synthase